MYIIKINAAFPSPCIPLGKQGENKARAVRFDVSEFLSQWPGAAVALAVSPPSAAA